uniref:Rho-GAP domain-containing protein n=1 Tax=Amphilophus citrinellus TaxID=61819 RepID=A0A3Q0R8Q8_AMPCI
FLHFICKPFINHVECTLFTNISKEITHKRMQHRGLFRLCGSVVRTRQLRQRWDCGERVDLNHEADVPTVASLLKLFFRELPVPIIPEPQRKQLVLCLTEKLCQIPDDSLNILSYLIYFLCKVAAHSQSNHMPVENLATIFGPYILELDSFYVFIFNGKHIEVTCNEMRYVKLTLTLYIFCEFNEF